MRRPAFTYIEMLIVIALIVAIASISLNAFSGAREQANFRKTVNDLVALIERARNMALNSEQVDTDGDGVPDTVLPYGVTATGTDLVLFGDSDEDNDYTSGSDVIVEKIAVDNDVEIDFPSSTYPIYTAPLAELTLYANDTSTDQTSLTITITSNATSRVQTVSINTVSRVPEIGS